ncbi:Rz-like lysis system protein LysB [Paraburkholderia sediminicola]|uniref:Rz-like lysis system protein LysB n=1 Tax=Paraburkholderia sediminicola TaxID=458836 RepID=UPI0038B797B6
MNAIAVRVIVIGAVVAAGIGAGLYVKALRADLDTAQLEAHDARETVGRRDAQIADLQKQQRDQATQLAQLEKTRQGIAADLAARKSELERLKRENESVRAWADGALPDDVVRLYASPALTGADDAAMRAGNGLHAAGNVAAP